MRRGLALASAYAGHRSVFGAPLLAQPLHRETLAELTTAYASAFALTFGLVDLVGRAEVGELDDPGRLLLRLMLPITKLVTGRQAVAATSEAVEAFGGAGYVEDTGLPALLRDTQVLPIWEGTTNVLALDALLRTDLSEGLRAWSDRVRRAVGGATDPRLAEPGRTALRILTDVEAWLAATSDPAQRQAGARRFAFALGRSMQVALLVEHAQWALDHEGDPRFAAMADRLARTPLESLVPETDVETTTILR
jgi:acyl-CoA dehydrogenase